MHDIDLLASDSSHDRVISIQVKTKTSDTWQTSTTRGRRLRAPEVETKYWVLVDLGEEYPEFYIVPKWWMENDIHKSAQQVPHRVRQAPRMTPAPTTRSRWRASSSGSSTRHRAERLRRLDDRCAVIERVPSAGRDGDVGSTDCEDRRRSPKIIVERRTADPSALLAEYYATDDVGVVAGAIPCSARFDGSRHCESDIHTAK